MKATLEFDLPDDAEEHRLAVGGATFLAVLWDLDQWLRARVKWSGEDDPEERLQAFEDARAHLHQLLSDHGVSLDR